MLIEADQLIANGDRTRADVTQIKAWLTRQEDRFRRPYGKIVEDFPRACVFAGTVNPIGIGYLKDASGGRRFWPVACGYINLDALKAAHSAANDIDPMKAAQNLPVPLHPGAARYYQEAGVPIE